MVPHLVKLIKEYSGELILGLCVVFICIISFNLGKISVSVGANKSLQFIDSKSLLLNGTRGPANSPLIQNSSLNNELTIVEEVEVVVSMKSKSGAYHFPWCPGAKQITEANRKTFTSEGDAIIAGYHLAGNCKK